MIACVVQVVLYGMALVMVPKRSKRHVLFCFFFLVAIFKVPHVINPGHLGKDMAHNRADSSGLEHKTALNM
jgi:hypothetical protein